MASSAREDEDASSVAALTARFEALEALASSWKNTGLTVFQRGAAESDALRIAANAELVSAGRREVSSKTREFAKLTAEQKLVELGSLVKSYQGYVDEITRALRHAESSHRNVHQFLRHLQDPYPALEKYLRGKQALLSLANAANSTASLRAQLRDREAELGDLRNQEVTIRQLREEISELELAATTSDRQSATDASAETQHLLQQWQERENTVQLELAQLSQECRKHQLLAVDLKQDLATAQDDLRATREQFDRAADEHQSEISDLRIQLGVAAHDRVKANEQLAALEQQLASGAGRTPASAARVRPPAPVPADEEATPQGQVMGRPPQDRRETDEDTPRPEPSTAAAGAAAATAAELQQILRSRDEGQVRLAQASEELDKLRNASDAADRRRAQTAEEHQRVVLALETTVSGLRSDVAACKGQLADAAEQERRLRSTIVDLQADLGVAERRASAAAAAAAGPSSSSSAVVAAATAAGNAAAFDLQAIVHDDVSNPVSANGRGTPVGPSATSSTSDSEVIASLKQQREGLRRRIRALEEVGLAEVKSMRAELETLKRENSDLLAQLNGSTRDPLDDTAAGVEAAPRHPPSLFGLARQSAVDRAAHVVSHLVLSSRQSRRAFAAYQLVLHIVLLLFAAYYIL